MEHKEYLKETLVRALVPKRTGKFSRPHYFTSPLKNCLAFRITAGRERVIKGMCINPGFEPGSTDWSRAPTTHHGRPDSIYGIIWFETD